jgi:hypothetical protein
MKEFRKNEEKNFICEECNLKVKSLLGLSNHIRYKHNKKNYFDKWIKDDIDDKCKICNKETSFISITLGYEKCCCNKCKLKYIDICAKKSIFKKFGSNSPFINKNTRNKSKETLRKRYGIDHNFKMEQVKTERIKTWKKNYGVDNPSKSPLIKEKKEKTCLKNHGVKNGWCLIEKRKKTCIEKYGVENPSQNKEIFEKQQKNSFYSKKFKNTNINYRSSYELDFLENYYIKFPDIQNSPSIKYIYKRKNKIYFPDFYIPSLNLIIECKNKWLANKDKNIIKLKEKFTLSSGFKYIMIINKNYNKFNIFIQN